MNANEFLAYAKARALGEDVGIFDFPTYVHVEPLSSVKEGTPIFVARPLEALEHAGPYRDLRTCRRGAKALAKLYGVPQAVWKWGSAAGMLYIHCAASIDVQLWNVDAVHHSDVDGATKL